MKKIIAMFAFVCLMSGCEWSCDDSTPSKNTKKKVTTPRTSVLPKRKIPVKRKVEKRKAPKRKTKKPTKRRPQTPVKRIRTKEDVFDWKQLTSHLPKNVGKFKAVGKVQGRTIVRGDNKITRTYQTYQHGDKKLRVKISDGTWSKRYHKRYLEKMNVYIDSPDKVQHKVNVHGQPGYIVWSRKRKKGRGILFVGGRYSISATLRPSSNPKEIEALLEKLKWEALAKMKNKKK